MATSDQRRPTLAPSAPGGGKPEPNSLRETAKREGKTLWQVRKDRGERR